MLPRANKYFHPSFIIDSKSKEELSIKERIQVNKSAQLSNIKKLSSNHFTFNSV